MDGDIILRISPQNSTIEVETHDNGIVAYKEISPETLVECLRGGLKQPEVHSGLLPENCIAFSSRESGERTVTILHPQRYADITYYKTCYQNFPLPRLAFQLSLVQGLRVRSVSVCVVEEGRLRPDSKLFHFPFSNVSGFHMCIGNNVLPKCESLHTLSSLPYHILSIPNNNDHYRSGNNKMGLEYRDLLEHLRDKEPGCYYESILVPSGKKLRQFISKEGGAY